jgi:Flp pilus assembly protein TadD
MNDPAIWNNLGVVATLEGNEDAALNYFHKAIEGDNAGKEALTNLGFIALKYRNGAEAERLFGMITGPASPDSQTAAIGQWEAWLQEGKFQEARDQLAKLSQDHQDDPYARLTASYFLMDVERQAETAKQLLTAYMQNQSLENDLQFRRALNQARQLSSSGGELPTPSATMPDANTPTASSDSDDE